MPLRRAVPFRHSPMGVCDTLDETETMPGSMALLQNLVPDPTTKNLWVPRPAAISIASFAGFTAPGFVSVQIAIGSLVVGMVATGRNPGYDEPFVFNLVSSAFVTVSGVSGSNVPRSPLTTGAWTPPTMDVIGTKVTLAHQGYDGVTNFVGWIDISNPAAPVYTAGNTAVNPLPSVPVAVAQFYERAYYICNPVGAIPAALATDVLDPTTRTNGSYTLTFGNNLPLTALKGLPLNTTLGGIVASLMVFQGAKNILQISGDFAPSSSGGSGTTSTIAVNSLNVATGTLAPNSVTSTPLGLMFMSPEGMRLINFTAQVSDPIGFAGDGVTVPFANAVVPSRVAAACNATVVRVSVQNGYALNAPQQEWWFDLTRKIWSGPHTFPASTISVYNDTFIMTPLGIAGSLWQSDPTPNTLTSYVENGTQLNWQYQTSLLSVRGNMEQCSMVESLLYAGYAPAGQPIGVYLNDQNGVQLGSVSLSSVGTATVWGAFQWGALPWAGQASALAARKLSWATPIVFDRVSLRAQGQSAGGVRLGDCYFKFQPLQYLATP